MVPPVAVHEYVSCAAAVAAVRPALPEVTCVGDEIAQFGTGVMVLEELPVACVPAPFVTTTLRPTLPDVPAVKVMRFVPAPAVTEPPVTVQMYVAPVCAGTLAVYPAVPAVTMLGAVTTAFGCA